MNSDSFKVSKEGVIVVSDGLSPQYIIQKILDLDTLSGADILYNSIKGYPWKFETKYYTAEINLYAVEEKISFESNFSESIKAFIFYFDSTKVTSFENILDWISFFEKTDAEIRLLVCNNCAEVSEYPKLLRKNVLSWCAKEQFELVELSPVEEVDEDDFIPEAKGYARIVEALQSHTWSNLIMKERNCPVQKEKKKEDETFLDDEKVIDSTSNASKTEAEECAKGTTEKSSNSFAGTNDTKKVKVGSDELSLEESWINNVVSGDDPGGESFEALFSKFASMKERAEGLTGDARKKYAEQVAIAFWKAMGGDEDEIEGLDE